MINGSTLIEWGFKPGPLFGPMLEEAVRLENDDWRHASIYARLLEMTPPEVEIIPLRTNALPFSNFMEFDKADCPNELQNMEQVVGAMDRAMRVPTIVAGAVMPDACPAGTLPVGGVVAAKDAIHPDMHSADICCSMYMTILKRKDDPKHVLDVAQKVTHFGPASKSHNPVIKPSSNLLQEFADNRFLDRLVGMATTNFMTQGDGNHFLYVGHLESTGDLCIVTHHGSRGVGAQLYKHGMAAAQKHTKIVAPEVDPKAAWLDFTRDEGREYWDALQIVRDWTKENHAAIHTQIAKRLGNKIVWRNWNEHNFVFRKSDGLFYHAKGATPSYAGYAWDDSGETIIPMNMAEPILLTRHLDRDDALGFAPHGAGRNMSRTAFLKANRPTLPEGIDVRSYCGTHDLSELPEAYKSAAHVSRIIREQRLADVFDRVMPYGSIMAGDWQKDAPWRKKRDAKNAIRT